MEAITPRISKKRLFIYRSIILAGAIFWVFYFRQFILEQYMRFKLRNSHIVVTLSTTPYRIDKLHTTLLTILQQNAPIKHIYLSVPYIFKRDNISYTIPKWLQEHDRITILRTEDYGPATKLLGLLKNVSLPNESIIITIDDDIQYEKHTLLHLSYSALRNPQSAIGISGADIYKKDETQQGHDRTLGLKTRYNFNGKVAILQGYAGIAYRRAFFSEDIFDVFSLPDYCILSDDIYFSFYLAKHKISRHTLVNHFVNTKRLRSVVDSALSANALQMLDPKPAVKNVQCIEYLQSRDPEVIFE